MNQGAENTRIMTRSRRAWRILGVVLFAAFVASCFVWGPFGFIFYAGGLLNCMEVFLVAYLVFVSILVAAVCLPVVGTSTIWRWRRLTSRQRLLRIGAVVASGALVGSFCMAFVGLTPAPYDMFVRGFAVYVESRADVGAIRDWLGTLDPNDYRDEYGGPTDIAIPPVKLPSSIARLNPQKAWALPDDAGHLKARLFWGGGFIGHWGVEIGDVTMNMPLIDSTGYLRYRPLAPGVYVWYELQ
jgi:hypothetical protein